MNHTDRTPIGPDPSALALYRAEFQKYLEAGDDEMNAELRIVENGCSVQMARDIAYELGSDEDDA